MTPAQKKSRENFKKAVAEAKKLRAKNPKLRQAQAVKQAWAILYSTGKVGKATSNKKATKKTASSTHKDTKSHNVNIRVVSGFSKSKKLQKDLKSKGLKLTHGYNVSKRKIGSINNDALIDLKSAINDLTKWQSILKKLQEDKKNVKEMALKGALSVDIIRVKNAIKDQKQHIHNIKKIIK